MSILAACLLSAAVVIAAISAAVLAPVLGPTRVSRERVRSRHANDPLAHDDR